MGDKSKFLIVSTIALSVLAVALLGFILRMSRGTITPLQERQPGMDKPPQAAQAEQPSPFAIGKLVAGTGVPATIPGRWPCFRGEKGDGIVAENIPIAREWRNGVPAKIWEVELGEGYAGAAILNGRVYVLDYDQVNQADALRCLSFADGKEIWRFSYPVRVKRNHGMSRTVPAVTDKYAISLGPKCHVLCVDSTTGKFIWGMDLLKEFNAEVPQWYAGQCPLIEGDRVILAPGGDALMIAVDCATGKIIWRTPNPRDWKMTHSTIVPMEFAGHRMYVYCGSGGVAGVAADDGALLWETDAWQISIATIPSPLLVGSGRIFLSGGYNAGSLMLQLKEPDGKITAEPLFRLKASEFGATQHTPILYQGYIYGVRPDGQLACLDLKGKVVWTSGATARFGLGPSLVANGLIFVMNDDGLLTLAEASPSGYHVLAQARVLNGHDSWAPMALAGGRLLARDLTQMVCLDITGGKP